MRQVMKMKKFSSKVIEQLKFYVYLYIDPRTDRPFYIGKGKGNRAFDHLGAEGDSDKIRIIAELKKAGLTPKIELLKYGLKEAEALLVEATAIDLLNIRNLTNESRGHGSRVGSRATVEEVVATLDAKPVTIRHRVLLININKAFRYGMNTLDLYDATRSAWRLGEKRTSVQYALSVYRGVVREVYSISTWVQSGHSIRGFDEEGRPPKREGRWEFIGVVADDDIRNQYLGRSVAAYFPKGNQNPVKYVSCDS